VTSLQTTRSPSREPSRSTSSRILLLGANGQLGVDLAQRLPALGEVKTVTRTELDLADAPHLEVRLTKLLDDFTPTLIVNAAAYTAVDQAEADSQTAFQVNAHAVRTLAQQAKARGCALIHYSTDYVFDGSGERPWTEQDAPHPLSVYGQSKWAGEQALTEVGGRVLVLRTSWVVGVHGGNFLKTMLRLARERDTLRVVADQIGVPTSTCWLAQLTIDLWSQLSEARVDDARWGTYHAVPSGETSWHGYAVHALAEAQRRGVTLRVDPTRIEAIRTEDYPLPASRPRNSRLDTHKLQQVFGVTPPAWQTGVNEVLDTILRGPQP
jgi:dTDP-4-dehydrorhamnose reductase